MSHRKKHTRRTGIETKNAMPPWVVMGFATMKTIAATQATSLTATSATCFIE
jgi:hypothetical protein